MSRFFICHMNSVNTEITDMNDCLTWLPLFLLSVAAFCSRATVPAWVFMWLLAAGIFFGCKWLTLRRAWRNGVETTVWRSLGYLLAWPGMEATRFLAVLQ